MRGYLAEPLIGSGLAELLGRASVPSAVGVAVGTAVSLLFCTLIQMLSASSCGQHGTIDGVVHVRDTLLGDPDGTAGDVMRPVLRLSAETPVYRALHTMRQTRNHLALVVDDGSVVGLITLTDVLHRLLPDPQSAA